MTFKRNTYNMHKLKVIESSSATADIVVIFSSANVKLGEFTGSGLFDNNWTKIYVNTSDNDWYLRGINEPKGDSIQSFTAYLIDIIKPLKTAETKTIFMGSSMGAYGAVLYGLKCQADYIFSFGAELTLGFDGGFFERECKIPEKVLSLAPDLIPAINENENSHIFLFSGENNSLDTYFLSKLINNENIFRFSIINAEHVVLKELHDEVGIQKLVSSFVKHNSEPAITLNNGYLFEYSDLCRSLYEFDHDKLVTKPLISFLDIPKLPNHIKSYIYRRLALTCKQNSLTYAQNAYLLNKSCGKSAIIYCRALQKDQKFKRIIEVLKPIVETASISRGKPFLQAFELLLHALIQCQDEYAFEYFYNLALLKFTKNEKLKIKLIEKYGRYVYENS